MEGGFTPSSLTFFPFFLSFCYPRLGVPLSFPPSATTAKGQGWVVGKNKINCSTYPIRWQSRCPGDADSLLSSMLSRENREMFFPSPFPLVVVLLFILFLFPSTTPFARLSLSFSLLVLLSVSPSLSLYSSFPFLLQPLLLLLPPVPLLLVRSSSRLFVFLLRRGPLCVVP